LVGEPGHRDERGARRRALVRRAAVSASAVVAPLLLGLALATTARAAQVDFSASVDQTTVGLGQQFQLVLSVQGEDMLSAPAPKLPPLPDFDVLGSTSSQSTNISIMNGRMTKQATVNFIYVLAAKRLGTATIPPCKLVYQGQEFQSQPITITVVKGAQGQAAPAPAPSSGISAPRSQVPLDGNIFVSVVPSRRSVYVGEPISVEVSLCTRFQISNGGWVFDAD
jgi:hypothetical protein